MKYIKYMSIEDRQIIKHFRTTGTTAPVASAITDGEIALSMDNTNPKIFFKKNNGDMATFVDKEYVDGLGPKVQINSSNTNASYPILVASSSSITSGDNYTAIYDSGLKVNPNKHSVTEGLSNSATAMYSHAEGYSSMSSGNASHAEGYSSTASGYASHAEGYSSTASGYASHAEGSSTASNSRSHAEGSGTNASGGNSHSEGYQTNAIGGASHAEGGAIINKTEYPGGLAIGEGSHAEGAQTTAYGVISHAEGLGLSSPLIIINDASWPTMVNGEPRWDVIHTSSQISSEEASFIWAWTHAGETIYRIVTNVENTGSGCNVYLDETFEKGDYSNETISAVTGSAGIASHREGTSTTAAGDASHAEGDGTIALNDSEHAEGRYNVSHKASSLYGNSGNTQHSIGIGTSSGDTNNAIEVMQNGDVYVNGIGNYDGSHIESATTLQNVISDLIPSKIPTMSLAFEKQIIVDFNEAEIYCHPMAIKLTDGDITDDLYILVGRNKRTHNPNGAKRRISYYCAPTKCPDHVASATPLLVQDLTGCALGKWLTLDYNSLDVMLQGFNWDHLGNTELLINYFWTGFDSKTLTGGEKVEHEGTPLRITGGNKGNAYSHTYYLTIARAEYIQHENNTGYSLKILEYGNTIPFNLRIMTDKECDLDAEEPRLVVRGNIGTKTQMNVTNQ